MDRRGKMLHLEMNLYLMAAKDEIHFEIYDK